MHRAQRCQRHTPFPAPTDCSQDLHSGTVSTPSDSTWGYRFAGRHILAGVLADLKAKHGLGSASEVILAGDSAGGMGVWVNLRFVAEALPGALVGGAPIAVREVQPVSAAHPPRTCVFPRAPRRASTSTWTRTRGQAPPSPTWQTSKQPRGRGM